MKGSRQILLIEDNKGFRLLMSHFLSKNYKVVSKSNGLEGMKWLINGQIPDLILLDLQMPEMTGNDFLEGLRSSGIYKDIPVIVISANKPGTITSRAMTDVQYYFEKPLDPRKLKDLIAHIFKNSQLQVSP